MTPDLVLPAYRNIDTGESTRLRTTTNPTKGGERKALDFPHVLPIEVPSREPADAQWARCLLTVLSSGENARVSGHYPHGGPWLFVSEIYERPRIPFKVDRLDVRLGGSENRSSAILTSFPPAPPFFDFLSPYRVILKRVQWRVLKRDDRSTDRTG